MTRPRVLVAGASGFVGRNVIDILLKRGDVDVVAGTRGAPPRDSSSVCWVELDVTEPGTLSAVFRDHKPTHILNLAAYGADPKNCDEAQAYRVNVRAVLDMLDLAASLGIKRFAQTGSCFEYGAQTGPIPETAPLQPNGPYAVTKSAASLLGLERARALKVDFAVLRLFGVWGPYEAQHRLVPTIRAGCEARRPVRLTAGLQIRDFSYAPEVARAMVSLLLREEPLPFDVINIGTGVGRPVREFAGHVAQALGCETLLEFGTEPMRTHEVPSLIADTARLKQTGIDLPETDVARQINDLIHGGGA